MTRRLIAVALVVVALAVVGNLIRGNDDGAEQPLTDPAASQTIGDVREAMTNAGVGGVQIEVDGDTLTLYGTVATSAELSVAEAVGRSVVGDEMKIDNQLTAEDSVDPASVGPAAATADELALQNRLSSLLARNPIVFESASSVIAAESIPSLDILVEELAVLPADVSLLIAGHTDSDGEEEANLALSQARADAVLAYLVAAGIDGNRLTAQGFGETSPIADNATQEGKAANRRIEMLVQP
jgi:outer membrane protein OmpA-like peptidoglycan-associated protein